MADTRPEAIIGKTDLLKLARRSRGMPAGQMSWAIGSEGYLEEAGLRFESKDQDVGQLYAALAVLSRDIAKSGLAPRSDAFERLVRDVSREEAAIYGAHAFPEYGGVIAEAARALPTGLAEAAASGVFSYDPLLDPGILHEWTFKPGKRLFERWLAENWETLKDGICSPGGLAAKFKRERDLLVPVAALIFLTFGAASFWSPIVGILAALVVRSIGRICGEPQTG